MMYMKLFLFARSAYYFRTGPFEKISLFVCLWVCPEISWFYRRGNGLWTEASLAWYFGRKNVRTTFQVRKVLSIKDILALVLVQNGIRKLDHLFSTFLNFFCFKISLFWTPHVISRRLGSNYTLASARPLFAGIV